MKLYSTMAVAAILFAGTATAQRVNIGIKGGLNVYNIHNSNNVTYDSKTGVNLGLLGHIHLSKEVAFQPEIVYSMQGAKYSVSNVETQIKLDYINIPLMFQYMFDNGFRLQAGPQVGLLVNAKGKTNGISTDIKQNLKGADFGLGVGAGYVFLPSGFGVDARYNFGLTTINKNSTQKSTNRGLQVGLFYQFDHH